MTRETGLVKRALLSVFDKTGVADFARDLAALGVELVSTGGTHKLIAAAGIAVRDMSDLTGFPEMMDGRVKTLHPRVHGGLLGVATTRTTAAAMARTASARSTSSSVNLYPFEATVASGAGYDEIIENIDIGGPAMIRSAAKNHAFVTVIVDPGDYAAVLEAAAGNRRRALRAAPAARGKGLRPHRCLRRCDLDLVRAKSSISATCRGAASPARCARSCATAKTRTNGPPSTLPATIGRASPPRPQVQGKSAQLQQPQRHRRRLRADLGVRSGRCGGRDHQARQSVRRRTRPRPRRPPISGAFATDPMSAFGGIVALNGEIDAAVATEIVKIFTEVIVAPAATDEAKAIIAGKKNLRLLLTGALADPKAGGLTVKSLSGGLLVQTRDNRSVDDAELQGRDQEGAHRHRDSPTSGWR